MVALAFLAVTAKDSSPEVRHLLAHLITRNSPATTSTDGHGGDAVTSSGPEHATTSE
jgi:hypothetical protein